jgi:hypothetical protein
MDVRKRQTSTVSPAQPGNLPRLVVDYDTDGADEDELTRFSIGAIPVSALCHSQFPCVYETRQTTLSPKAVWTALGEPADSVGRS